MSHTKMCIAERAQEVLCQRGGKEMKIGMMMSA
jgi:hypothetical protein